ncbi:hypothetical protein BDN72DRAFT_895267 [Pluteus cervinus]|uniref:Uncharacterized protein n=1 Tax=Pluteus cervinus TaxID=181527 RepID=A0ACD3B1H1_9AGAR|nr:hypothetical protein BDN72DRAFT_895267 [Pluteus cervinus]
MLPFLHFPTELRLKTYTYYLESAIIRIPGPPLPNTLALLSTCRTIYQEASPQVISTATFSLWSTRNLIHFLGSLSDNDLRALRHIAVCVTMYYFEGMAHGTSGSHSFADALSYFPGLQLDTLTVYTGYYGHQFDEVYVSVYSEIEQMIVRGMGWKELRFFSRNMGIINTNLEEQPKERNETLKRRDGEGSGASVSILVAKKLVPYTPFGGWTSCGAIMTKDTTTSPPDWEGVDEDAPWREEDYIGYGHGEFEVVPHTAATYEQRALAVVARRGNTANHVEESDIPDDFRQFLEKYSWKEIRDNNLIEGYIFSDDVDEFEMMMASERERVLERGDD